MKKRILSFFLSLAMLLSLLPTTAFAEGTATKYSATLTVNATNVDVYYYYCTTLPTSAVTLTSDNLLSGTEYKNEDFYAKGGLGAHSGYIYIYYVPHDGYLLETATSEGSNGTLPLTEIGNEYLKNVTIQTTETDENGKTTTKTVVAQGFASYSRVTTDNSSGNISATLTVSAKPVTLDIKATSDATGETVGVGSEVNFTVKAKPNTTVSGATITNLAIDSLKVGNNSYTADDLVVSDTADDEGYYTVTIKGTTGNTIAYTIAQDDITDNTVTLTAEATVTYENKFKDKTNSDKEITGSASVSASTTTNVSITDKFTVTAQAAEGYDNVITNITYDPYDADNEQCVVFKDQDATVTWAIADEWTNRYDIGTATVEQGTATASQTNGTLSLTGIQSNITVTITPSPKSFKINYHLNDDTANVASKESNPDTYIYGAGVNEFVDATRSNYTFLGWYSDENCTTRVDSIGNTTYGEVDLYAKWEPKTEHIPGAPDENNTTGLVTVTCTNELMQSSHVPATYGLLAGAYEVSAKGVQGNDVVGYTCEVTVSFKQYKEAFAENKTGNHALVGDTTSATLTLTYNQSNGKWEVSTPAEIHVTCTNTVTFNSNGGSTVASQTVATGSQADSSKATTTKENYVFKGWYTNETCTGKDDEATYHFASTVTEDITLHAHWEKATAKQPKKPSGEITGSLVKVDCVNGNVEHTEKIYNLLAGTYTARDVQGNDVDGYTCEVTVNANSYDQYLAKYVAEVTEGNHALVKDQSSQTLKLAYDLNTQTWSLATGSSAVTINVTCTNKVTYDYGYDDKTSADDVATGTELAAPTTPVRTGYVFDAWYDDSTPAKEYVFPYKVISDITLYAKWDDDTNNDSIADKYQVTVIFNTDGHGTLKVGDAEENTITQVFTLTDGTKYATSGTIKPETVTYKANPGCAFDGWTVVYEYANGTKSESTAVNSPFVETTVTGGTTITYTANFDIDKQGGQDKDGNEIGDGIPDKYQVFVKFVSSDPAKGTVTTKSDATENTGVYQVYTDKSNSTTITVTPSTDGIAITGIGGYVFDGWKLGDQNLGTIIPALTGKKNQTYTYVAQWTEGHSDRPDEPDENNTADNVVKVTCENTLMQSHGSASYGLLEGAYTVSAKGVQGNDVDGYTCEVTVAYANYVTKYNDEIEQGNHALVTGSAASTKVKLTYTNGQWTLENPVEIDVTCTNTVKYVYGYDNKTETKELPTGTVLTKPTDPTRRNYVFDAWYTDSEFENAYGFGSALTTDIVLYANWDVDNWNAEKNTTDPTKDGDGIPDKYQAVVLVTSAGNGTITSNATQVFTLTDENKNCTTTGTITPEVAGYEAASGFAFDYWTKDGTKMADPFVATSVTGNQIVNIVAHFDIDDNGDNVPDKYQVFVKFEADDNGKVEGKTTQVFTLMNGTEYATSGTITLNKDDVTIIPDTGYAFDYWTKDNGTVSVKPFDTWVVNGGDEITYVAHFDIDENGDEIPDKYQVFVTFTSAGHGTVDNDTYQVFTLRDKDGNYITSSSINPKNVTTSANPGYTFGYWTEGTGTERVDPFVERSVSGGDKITFTAHFAAQASKIVFVANGGSAAEGYSIDEMNGETDQLISDQTMPHVIKTGYTFAGWYDTDSTTGNNVTQLPACFQPGVVTYYAQWTADAATIVFETNGGEAVPSMVGVTDQEIKDTTMPTSTKEGFTLVGWTDKDGKTVDNLPATYPAGTTTYYAKWEKDEWSDKDNSTEKGDGIPDKYQAVVQVTTDGNGTITSNATQVFTLKDADDNNATEGKITPAVAAYTANAGYAFDYWTKDDKQTTTPFETVTVTGGQIISIVAHFAIDKQGTKDKDGNEIGDNTPDKYQAFVKFETDGNGTLTGATYQVFDLRDSANNTITPETVTYTANTGYAFDGWTVAAKDIDGNATESKAVDDPFVATEVNGGDTITYTANFAEDVIGGTDPVDPETGEKIPDLDQFEGTPIYPDGIPDKYQATVVFTSAKNGTVTGNTTQVFTLKDEKGNYMTSGTITPANEVQTNPDTGYAFYCWTKKGVKVEDPFTAQTVSGGETITYQARWTELDTITLTTQSIAAYVGGTSQNGGNIPELRYEVTSPVSVDNLTFTLHTVKDGKDTAQTMNVTSPEDCDYYLFPELDFDMGSVAENTSAVLRSTYLKLVDQNTSSTTNSGIYELALRTIANDDWDSWFITASDGKNVYKVNLDVSNTQISIREVSDEDDACNAPDLMMSAVVTEGQKLNASADVATAVVTDTTTFATNGKESLGLLGTEDENGEDEALIGLLFDETISPVEEVTPEDLQEMLLQIAEEESDEDYSQWNSQFKYMDLVNMNDGNAIVTASEDVTIYWPYPDGITYENADEYEFEILHYKGFERNNAMELDLTQIQEVEDLEVTPTEYGLEFTTSSFSSFTLLWKAVPALETENHYAYIIGRSDGNVYPEATITRAEVATIFFRLLTDETRAAYLTTENKFTDVNKGQWYNTAISTLTAMGILKGTSDTTFDPNRPITRAELAAICARFDKGEAVSTNVFSDISGHWAESEILRAADLGWVLGYTDGTFRPDQDITRAETVTMINRVLGRVPETKADLSTDMTVWPDNMDESQWYYLAIQEATNSHDYTNDSKEVWSGITDTPDWKQYETK